ncbi:MAG: hypothetical protein M0Z32_09365 [Actinomycetota bacterium]|nr:hypothetical protein [Actinomycetota bacterium]MCL6093675.1 hypothetical protein [Actinomycetota bacterium]MDA8167930.1 hypothetical protein [Actinomycetota bacterium]
MIIAALKGRIFSALFGVFIPTLALVGAIKLARPGSVWSRRFYKRANWALKTDGPSTRSIFLSRYEERKRTHKEARERLFLNVKAANSTFRPGFR